MTPKTPSPLKHLLSPTMLGDLPLKNAMVMAPLTRSRAGEKDCPTPLMANYYQQRATAGLIITEASQISAQGKGYPHTPGIFTEDHLNGWAHVVQSVHEKGGRIFLQLWHVGRLSHRDVQPNGALPVAPSALKADGTIFTETGLQPLETPRALEIDEIPALVEDFRNAAQKAKQAGFDGVEIHAANGYLIDQFLRDGTNHRTDAYGGTPANRARFLKEIVEAVTTIYAPSRVGVRISPIFDGFSMSDQNPAETFGYVAEMLSPYGLAYLHVMQLGAGHFDFGALRQKFKGVYLANGGYDANSAEAALAAGGADLISFGTKFLANPDLVDRFRQNAALNTPDPDTFYQGGAHGYTDYPTLSTQG